MADRMTGDVNGGSVAPVLPEQRLQSLDVLRGFTLVGVLLVNTSDYTRNSHEGLDPLWYQTLAAATGGKFATLFQLMFGIGFAIQMDRWRGPTSHVVPRYVVRCAVLFLIGWVAEFLGGGLIVAVYAMTALGLLLFRNAASRTLILWGVAFLVLYSFNADKIAISRMQAWRSRDPSAATLRQEAGREGRERMNTLVRRSRTESPDSYWHSRSLWIQANVERFRQGLVLPSLGTFTLFLLGVFLWRQRVFDPPVERNRQLLLFTILALTIGLAGQIWAAFTGGDETMRAPLAQATRRGLGFTTRTLLSLGYASLVLMLHHAGVLRRLWSLLAWQGRMGLTVFIAQNFILAWLYYDWGLGLKNLSYRWDIPITLITTAVLIVACRAWLGRFRAGPVEWLWRVLTYRLTSIRPGARETTAPATT